MIEDLQKFRTEAAEKDLMGMMESIADFGDMVAAEFPQAFPDLPPDEYQHTELWHLLVGSTLPVDYRLTESEDVKRWLEEKMSKLIDAF